MHFCKGRAMTQETKPATYRQRVSEFQKGAQNSVFVRRSYMTPFLPYIVVLAGFALVAFIVWQAFNRTDALVELGMKKDQITMKLNSGSPDPKSGDRDVQSPDDDGSTP